MNDLHRAIEFSREAAEARQAAYRSGDKQAIAAACVRCANTQDNLIAALERLQPAGEVVQVDEEEDGGKVAWVQLHHDVELGTILYRDPTPAFQQSEPNQEQA